jgi:streptogramin lyase
LCALGWGLGNLWFTEPRALGRITTTSAITEHTMGLNPQRQPNDITLGPDGNVWFTDQYANQREIGRVTPAGTSPSSTTA